MFLDERGLELEVRKILSSDKVYGKEPMQGGKKVLTTN